MHLEMFVARESNNRDDQIDNMKNTISRHDQAICRLDRLVDSIASRVGEQYHNYSSLLLLLLLLSFSLLLGDAEEQLDEHHDELIDIGRTSKSTTYYHRPGHHHRSSSSTTGWPLKPRIGRHSDHEQPRHPDQPDAGEARTARYQPADPGFPIRSSWGHATLREDPQRQDHHLGCRGLGHPRQPEDQDPGEGGHPRR